MYPNLDEAAHMNGLMHEMPSENHNTLKDDLNVEIPALGSASKSKHDHLHIISQSICPFGAIHIKCSDLKLI